MNPTQKRCLMASGGTHLLLLSILVFGSAFFVPEPKKVPNTPLKMVPSMLVDQALSGGGGNPNRKPSDERIQGHIQAPPPKPQTTKPREPEPPKPTPKKPEPIKPEPPKPPKKKPDQPKPPKPKPERRKLVLKDATEQERKKVLGQSTPKPDRTAQREAERLAKEVEALRQGFSDGTAVEVHGTGGVAYANYADMIFQIYDQNWDLTHEGDGGNAVTKAKVVILRNGRVKEARIIRRSGNAVLDKSVQRTLDRVRNLPPFPAGTRDREREFIINFNLESRSISA